MEHKMLAISNLSIGYKKSIVKNINSSLAPGDFVVLLASNGAGKSTLIKTLTQKIESKEGEVKLESKLLSHYSKYQLSKKIAIVSTNHRFDLNLTVYDILALGRLPYLNLLGQLKAKDIEIINQYIDKLEVGQLLKKYFHQLSDGQKQKVLIARALIQDAPIIILDEPTAHLDIKNKFFIFQLLKEIAIKERKSILCATHEVDVALKHCSKVWLIDKEQRFIATTPNEININKVYSTLF